ncbi:hypothetical protein CCR85_08600 [Rhodothalassium salexigens]|uniref:LPS assembly lipoprotein LptE n=1 Tax=Rhodothalassium salexigens TaxID=1086 RepID=UPI0019138AC8|nr:LPS assembly lipoprotein LptE [Rhodothalassium salexigens]MBK5911546.1 hypothetical protein [Rhodothalassium salexigens]
MWWSADRPGRARRRRRGVLGAGLVGLALALQGCGFEPLHANGGGRVAASAHLARVAVAEIGDPAGLMLRNGLIDRLTPAGYARDPRYDLSVVLREDRDRYGFEADREVTRERLRLTAVYRLVDRRDGAILVSDRARAQIGYDVVQSDYALVTARDAARRQAAERLADDITRRLSVALKDRADEG